MKRIILLAGVLGASVAINAQVQRMVLVEEFTQASCGPCASQNPAFNTLLSNNMTKATSIKYQTSWPGTDPMNAQTQSEGVGSRVSYYSVSGVPTGIVDGVAIANDCGYYAGAPACLSQAEVDAAYAVGSPFSMVITPTLNATFDSITVNISLTTPAGYSGTTPKLQAVLVEKHIAFATAPGSNGEKDFYNVFRRSATGISGYALPTSWASAENNNYTFTFPMPSYIYKVSEMAIVAFVQDDATKAIQQAGIADVGNVPSAYGVTQNISGTQFECSSTISGITVDFKNIGTATISSANVMYSVDGGPATAIPYSGTLTVGSTATVNIPTISGLSNGTHTIDTWVEAINGGGAGGNMGPTSKSINIFSGASTVTPLTQNFNGSSFPYTNWILEGPDAGELWERVTTNSGSMKYDNYTYNSGSNSTFYVEPVDLTSLTNAELTFDVAYCQYGSENDRLQVYVSTNCGGAWNQVYNKAGSALATKASQTSPFTPTSGQWRTETVDISAFGTATQLFIRYKATSNYGNNLYVDNINIASGSSTAGIENNSNVNLNIYPNPATDYITITFTGDENVTVNILNALGQKVKVFNNINNNSILHIDDLSNGVYFLDAVINGYHVNHRIIKN